ncbi:MAG: hypothetical protein AAFQ80_17710 [Cyanobacteria bacterium J06621_8]
MSYEDLKNFISERREAEYDCIRKQKRGVILELIEDAEMSMEELSQHLLSSNVRQQTITQALQLFQGFINIKFIKNADHNLIYQSKKELFQMGLQRNIQFTSYAKNKVSDRDKWFRGSNLLETRGLDPNTQIKQSLTWLDCLSEYFFHTSFFTNHSVTTNDKPYLVDATDKLIEDEEANNNFQNEHEEVIYQLFQNGFLQCDLDK